MIGFRSAHRVGVGPRGMRALSLIEVLVVVGIIALLAAVLLPSLSAARAQAREAACANNIGRICQAEGTYQTEHAGWIPGSPWTTGYTFLDNVEQTWNPARGINRFVVEWLDYATPLRVQMYGPGSIPRPAGKTPDAAKEARDKMFILLTAEPFHCPANRYEMSWAQGHGRYPGPTVSAVSYMTMWPLMRGGIAQFFNVLRDKYVKKGKTNYRKWPGLKAVVSEPDEPWLPVPDKAPDYVAHEKDWDIRITDDYMPRHNHLGRESLKVFVADGTRFYQRDSTELTYTTDPRAAKGIVSATPPCVADDDNPYDDEEKSREYTAARRYSYRHGRNNRINAGFFDGHVQSLEVDWRKAGDSGHGFTGSAVHPKYYYPSGSEVQAPEGLHRSTIAAGTILP